MREIAGDGGAVLVDPRDDHALADAMRMLLTDEDELNRLSAQAQRRPLRTWDTYAAQTWDLLTS
jgi:glycosyltransferase involved in cell wall biosynthesis